MDRKFREIDFIKGIAIIWVVVFHMFKDFNAVFMGKAGVSGLSFSHLFMWGALGVDLFIICSGFLLAYSYSNSAEIKSFGGFLLRRLKRIVPLYYIAIFSVLVLDYFIGRENFQVNAMSIILHMLGLHTFTGYIMDIEGAWWFIGLIIQLYLLFPFIHRSIQYFNKFYVLIFCFFLTVASKFIDVANINTNYSVFAFLPDFVAGMILYKYIISEKTKNLKTFGIAFCTISMSLFFYAMLKDISIFSFCCGLVRPIVSIGIFLLLFAAYKGSIRIYNPFALFICLFGVNSYAIYLFHRPAIYKYVTFVSPIINKNITIVLYLLLMLIVGIALTRLEKQLFVFFRRFRWTT